MSYPLPVFHFSVDFGGSKMEFQEVSGLNIENQVIEYRHGLDKAYGATKMPGIPKYGNITLKRGIFNGDNEYFDWLNEISMNKIERRDVVINLLNEEHAPIMTWTVKKAFPVKLEGPGLKSTGNEVAIESLELAHEGLKVEAA